MTNDGWQMTKEFNVGKVESRAGSIHRYTAPGSCHCMADVLDLILGKCATVRIPLIACLAWVCLPLNVTARGVMTVASSS